MEPWRKRFDTVVGESRDLSRKKYIIDNDGGYEGHRVIEAETGYQNSKNEHKEDIIAAMNEDKYVEALVNEEMTFGEIEDIFASVDMETPSKIKRVEELLQKGEEKDKKIVHLSKLSESLNNNLSKMRNVAKGLSVEKHEDRIRKRIKDA